MRRLISLLLSLSLVFSMTYVLFSCGGNDGSVANPGEDNGAPEEGESGASIFEPEYKDYGRGTIDFDNIVYEEPDFTSLDARIEALTLLMKSEGEKSVDEIEAAITEIEDAINSIKTMGAYARIMQSRDLNESFWDEEYKKITTAYSETASNLRTLLILMANSEIAKELEERVFGENFIDNFKDEEAYSDYLVELMKRENELVSEYNAISMASVEVTFADMTDTAENLINHFKNIYGEESLKFISAKTEITLLYQAASSKMSETIYIELVKVRNLIARESGYLNYRDYAYENLPHEYSYQDTLKFINGTKNFIIPVYVSLAEKVFYPYSKTTRPKDIDRVTLINLVHEVMGEIDPTMQEAYEYMLQHGLYSIEESGSNRLDASFTTYLNEYEAPYVFVTGTSTIKDVTTLAHEFGHFYDFYLNDGEEASLDLLEISSQALEYLAILSLSGNVSDEDVLFLRYSTIEDAMLIIIQSAFFALCEEYIYTLPYENINKQSIDYLITNAAKSLGLNYNQMNEVADIIYPQTVTTPFYMQSYATSLFVALEIYFAEYKNEGEGLQMYKTIIDRREGELTFPEMLLAAKIPSVFESEFIKDLADKIHLNILGSHYFSSNGVNTTLKHAA